MRLAPLALLCAVTAPALAADITLPLQGRLLDAAGGPLNGTTTLTVAIVATQATPADAATWSDTFSGVALEQGYFSLILGTGTPLQTSVLDVTPHPWAVITANGAELSRQALRDVPYAAIAARAHGIRVAPTATTPCDATTQGDLVYEDGAGLFVCLGGSGWASVSTGGGVGLTTNGGAREWADGTVASSCHDYRFPTHNYAYIGATGDGKYRIDRDLGGTDANVVTCDMTTDGGGWTLVQRTVWDWSASSALHTTMTDWTATTVGDSSPGTAFRVRGADWNWLNPAGELLAKHHIRNTDGTTCATPINNVSRFKNLRVSPTAVSVELFANLQGGQFSSADLSASDIGPSTQCTATGAGASSGVPWFYSSCCSLCPTYMGGYWTDQPHPMWYPGAAGSYVPGVDGQVADTACPNRQLTTNGQYIGDNAMEIYLR